MILLPISSTITHSSYWIIFCKMDNWVISRGCSSRNHNIHHKTWYSTLQIWPSFVQVGEFCSVVLWSLDQRWKCYISHMLSRRGWPLGQLELLATAGCLSSVLVTVSGNCTSVTEHIYVALTSGLCSIYPSYPSWTFLGSNGGNSAVQPFSVTSFISNRLGSDLAFWAVMPQRKSLYRMNTRNEGWLQVSEKDL